MITKFTTVKLTLVEVMTRFTIDTKIMIKVKVQVQNIAFNIIGHDTELANIFGLYDSLIPSVKSK